MHMILFDFHFLFEGYSARYTISIYGNIYNGILNIII